MRVNCTILEIFP